MRRITYPEEYLNIIIKAKQRGLTDKQAKELGIDGQLHHIIPKCVAPELINEKSNIVFLTHEEHYQAHKMLAKANPTDNIAIAWSIMSANENIEMSQEDYAEAMKLASIIKSINTKLSWQDDDYRNKHLLGFLKRIETYTEDDYKRMSDRQKSLWQNDEFRNKVMTFFNSDEWKKQSSERMSGENNPRSLSIYCEEEPDIIYTYAKKASIELNIDYSSLMGALDGRQKSAGKMPDGSPRHWHFADAEKEKEAEANRELKYKHKREMQNARRKKKKN